ncbi:hypothetical protein RQP46_005944 [Phenoliferia psychrophenolica]
MRSIIAALGVLGWGAASAWAQVLYRANLASCLDQGSDFTAPIDQQLNFTSLWAQFDVGQQATGQYARGFDVATRPTIRGSSAALTGTDQRVLRLVLVGSTGDESQGYSNSTSYLSTIDIDAQVLTFPIASNESALCSSIRSPNAQTTTTSNGTATVTDSGCPYGPGDVALGLDVPLGSSYPLTTITTRVVVLDPSMPALHLACYDVDVTPYYPHFFAYKLVTYLVVALLALYCLAYLVARVWAAHSDFVHESETQLATSLTLKLSSTDAAIPKTRVWGSVWWGAWSGRQVVGSGSLRRYLTAEFRELWHVALWWSLVGTVAVEWPDFSYPVFARTAWTNLIYSNSLSFTSPAPSVLPSNFTPPATYATQMADINSPLYLNSTLPNVLLDLGTSKHGITKWALAVGVRPDDLWSVCAFTFFVICAATVGFHLIFFAVDSLQKHLNPRRGPPSRPQDGSTIGGSQGGGPAMSDKSRPSYGDSMGGGRVEEGGYGYDDQGEEEGFSERALYEMRARPEDDYQTWELHSALLQGNLMRLVFLFHLPLTLFSVYEITRHEHSTSSFALAVVTLAVVCVVAPAAVVWRVHRTPVRELYTSLPHLLSLGTMYSGYSDECTMFGGVRLVTNLVVGVVVGAAQSAGTAQAAVILLVEVTDTLVTSLWLPWGDNAAMGPLAFVLSISRIIVAVLLVVLSPAVAVSASAAAWLAYIILLMQGLVLVLLFFVLGFKIVELAVRLIGQVPFDESRSARSGGLKGALRKYNNAGGGGKKGRSGGGGGGHRRREVEERRRRNLQRQGRMSPSEDTIGTQTRMLPGRPTHHTAQSRTSSSISSSYADGYNARPQQAPINFGEDDGYIMSAMSNQSWGGSNSGSSSPGYVKPGSYAGLPPPQVHQQPILRAGPAWGAPVTVVPAPSVPAATTYSSPPPAAKSSGFTRVGGGRASSSNPYQLANAASAYPPYPVSSADLYQSGGASSPGMPGNPRRMSQSAVIEMAAATDPDLAMSTSQQRPSPGSLPSSSTLLSNTVKPYRTERRPSIASAVPTKGFFGRFRKPKRKASTDFSSDDDGSDSEEDDVPTQRSGGKGLGAWGLRFGAGRKPETMVEETESDVGSPAGGESGFVVTRKPRPKPTMSRDPSGGTLASVGDPLQGQSVPRVSVEAPSDGHGHEEELEVVMGEAA